MIARLLALLLLASALNAAENWPCWRGPRGDGSVENAPDLAVLKQVSRPVAGVDDALRALIPVPTAP
jgi:hypothetical protein